MKITFNCKKCSRSPTAVKGVIRGTVRLLMLTNFAASEQPTNQYVSNSQTNCFHCCQGERVLLKKKKFASANSSYTREPCKLWSALKKWGCDTLKMTYHAEKITLANMIPTLAFGQSMSLDNLYTSLGASFTNRIAPISGVISTQIAGKEIHLKNTLE